MAEFTEMEMIARLPKPGLPLLPDVLKSLKCTIKFPQTQNWHTKKSPKNIKPIHQHTKKLIIFSPGTAFESLQGTHILLYLNLSRIGKTRSEFSAPAGFRTRNLLVSNQCS
uniref:Uncharacterized protein n=1 Tax=Cacopsylla melanoneura TaxID=428564 RepID=A0A8D8U3N4_9HEMI